MLDAAEVEAVSGGVVSFTDGTAQTHNNKHLKDGSGFDATLGDPNDTTFLTWGGDGVEGGYGTGSGTGDERSPATCPVDTWIPNFTGLDSGANQIRDLPGNGTGPFDRYWTDGYTWCF